MGCHCIVIATKKLALQILLIRFYNSAIINDGAGGEGVDGEREREGWRDRQEESPFTRH